MIFSVRNEDKGDFFNFVNCLGLTRSSVVDIQNICYIFFSLSIAEEMCATKKIASLFYNQFPPIEGTLDLLLN